MILFSQCLAFAIVIGPADDLAMSHIGTLLTATLAVNFTYFIITFNCIATHLLTIPFLIHLLRMFQCDHLFNLLDGHVIDMVMIRAGTGHTGSLKMIENETLVIIRFIVLLWLICFHNIVEEKIVFFIYIRLYLHVQNFCPRPGGLAIRVVIVHRHSLIPCRLVLQYHLPRLIVALSECCDIRTY